MVLLPQLMPVCLPLFRSQPIIAEGLLPDSSYNQSRDLHTPIIANNPQHSDSSLAKSTYMTTNHSLSSVVINCQSILAKKSVFQNFLANFNPSVVIGCESWLSPEILSSKIFPSHYQVYRKDRPDGYGAVFIACQDCLLSSELSYSTVYPCELVVC